MAKILDVSEPTIKRVIKTSSKIMYVGSSKNGHWEVLEHDGPKMIPKMNHKMNPKMNPIDY